MAEPIDASSVLNSLREQADKAAGLTPFESPISQRFAPGEGIAAGLEELLERTGERDKTPPGLDKVGRFFSEKLSNFWAFGINLGTGGFGLGSKIAVDMWHHKGELAAGMAGGALTKTAIRVLLAGSGGWVATAGIGLVGGAAGSGLKEYVKQRGDLTITEAGDKFVIDGLRNEFRRFGAADKGKIGKAALRGAAFGVAGAVLSDVVANNEWIQEQVAKIHLPSVGKPSVVAEATPEPTQTAVPTAEATATPGSPAPTSTPSPVATSEFVPDKAPSAPEATAPAENLPFSKETISLKPGSNPSSEMYSVLEQQLGRPPQVLEVKEAVTRFMEENNITDAAKVPADKPFSIQSINEYVKEISGGQPEAGLEIASFPEEIPLPDGSNPWNEVSDIGGKYLGRKLTNQEIMHLTKVLCKDSGIAVPIWDLNEGVDHVKLRIGFPLKVKGVYKILEQMKAGTALPNAA